MMIKQDNSQKSRSLCNNNITDLLFRCRLLFPTKPLDFFSRFLINVFVLFTRGKSYLQNTVFNFSLQTPVSSSLSLRHPSRSNPTAATAMDSATLDKRNTKRIKAVQNSFGASGSRLSKPGRVLLTQGRLVKQCRRRPQPKVFFLFSDMLVYGSVVIKGRWHKKQRIIPLGESCCFQQGPNFHAFLDQ